MTLYHLKHEADCLCKYITIQYRWSVLNSVERNLKVPFSVCFAPQGRADFEASVLHHEFWSPVCSVLMGVLSWTQAWRDQGGHFSVEHNWCDYFYPIRSSCPWQSGSAVTLRRRSLLWVSLQPRQTPRRRTVMMRWVWRSQACVVGKHLMKMLPKTNTYNPRPTRT